MSQLDADASQLKNQSNTGQEVTEKVPSEEGEVEDTAAAATSGIDSQTCGRRKSQDLMSDVSSLEEFGDSGPEEGEVESEKADSPPPQVAPLAQAAEPSTSSCLEPNASPIEDDLDEALEKISDKTDSPPPEQGQSKQTKDLPDLSSHVEPISSPESLGKEGTFHVKSTLLIVHLSRSVLLFLNIHKSCSGEIYLL